MSADAADNRPARGQIAGQETSDFAGQVQPHMPVLLHLAARLAPKVAPEDVVQEALVRAWRHRSRFDPDRGPFLSWLLAIVGNEARRASSRGRLFPIRIEPKAESVSVDDRLDIEVAIRGLSPRQRLAIDCFYFVGLTTSQTAAVMECSEGTVKSTLADARAKLRSQLEDHR
jgi:RNA polymerase sigma-70 factor, ECF subfamily